MEISMILMNKIDLTLKFYYSCRPDLIMAFASATGNGGQANL